MIDWSNYPNFSESEFTCHCGCGQTNMDELFLNKLQRLRMLVGKPITISSGYRCDAHNASIGGGPEHPLGKAADIVCYGEHARNILRHSGEFTRIGVKQKGDMSKRFIHLGTADDRDGVQSPWVWSY